MDKKPSLKDYLKSNPSKGLNDYYEEFGHWEEKQTPEVQPITKPVNTNKPPQEEHIVKPPRSYIAEKKKDKGKIDILNILASIIMIASFFLPWMDMTKFKDMDEHEMVNGLEMYTMFGLFNLESFTNISNYTIYLIPLGAIVALIGELIKNWATRIMGQILAFCFGIYWTYKLYNLFTHKELHIEELVLFDYLQYGFFMALLGVLIYFIDIIRTTFGNR